MTKNASQIDKYCGIFETFLLLKNRENLPSVIALKKHLQRFESGSKYLGFEEIDPKAIRDNLVELSEGIKCNIES